MKNTAQCVRNAMNTIPLTFDENLCNCTVLGGINDENSSFPVSLLLLNRNAGNFKFQSLENLLNCGFKSIISMESTKDNFKLEALTKKFPQVKLIIPCEQITVGDMINLGIAECTTPYLMVLWDDFVIKPPVLTDLLMTKIFATDALCFSPVFVNSLFQNVPVKMSPYLENNIFSVLPSQVIYDNTKTLFPFDFSGIYNKKKFMNICGFDSSIKTSYWQLLDFSVRCWLWGEKIITSPIFRMVYQNKEPILDATLDHSYFRFFLKNVAPSMKVDYAYVPFSRFLRFHRHSIYSFGPAISEFKRVRKWVSKNKFRYKTDMEALINSWEKTEKN